VYKCLGYEIRDVNEVSNERNLYDYLMFEYTPSVRPVRNDSDSIHLYVDVNLYMLEDLVRTALLYLVISSLFWVSINVVTAHRLIFSCPFFGAKQYGLSHDLRLFWPEIVV